MKIREFKYEKKDGKTSEYELLILNESEKYLAGVDLKKLDAAEKEKVKAVVEEFEEKLKPFMKAYRKFIVENIINEVSE